MAKLVLFGAGDIARLAHYYFTRDSVHEVVAFTVDKEYRDGDTFLGLPLVDFEELTDRYPPSEYSMFVALSYAKMNTVRAEKYRATKELGYELVSYVSSRCTFLSDHAVGDNCFILEDNTIQPFVKIGNDVTLWSGNHIGHDSRIDDHTFIASHIVVSGNCHVGEYCFLGVNATLHNSINIAPRTLIAAGATIPKDTVEESVHVPARSTTVDRKSSEIPL
jgi:sugar O-acyltransferase (sialic acid O-acetyltransferase NeuD family)